jgi:hypothetical protein
MESGRDLKSSPVLRIIYQPEVDTCQAKVNLTTTLTQTHLTSYLLFIYFRERTSSQDLNSSVSKIGLPWSLIDLEKLTTVDYCTCLSSEKNGGFEYSSNPPFLDVGVKYISILTKLFLALAQCCAMLRNIVQLLQVSKLQTEPTILRFRQVAASKLFRDLL